MTKRLLNQNNQNNPVKKLKKERIIQSKEQCRNNGKCHILDSCNYVHPKQIFGNSLNNIKLWAQNIDADNLIGMDDSDLFHYKFLTTIFLMSYYISKKLPLNDFFSKQTYFIEFLEELNNQSLMYENSNTYIHLKIDMMFENITKFLNSFECTLNLKTQTPLTLKESLTSNTLLNADSITLWRGFRSNYNPFLDDYEKEIHKPNFVLQTPLILATSLAEDVAYRFTDYKRYTGYLGNSCP